MKVNRTMNAKQIERWAPWVLLVITLVIWQGLCSLFNVSEFVFPSPLRIWEQLVEFRGTIARIGLESDRVNEERRVLLTCADCPAEMFLGEQAEVRILTGTRASALMVPEVAISGFDGFQGQVWTVQDGRLVRAELTFGARDDRGRIEVTGGLPEGAQIVANPPQGADEGRLSRIGYTP